MKKYITILVTTILLLSCAEGTSSNSTINLEETKVDSLYMSEYFESIDYIKLETNPECLINGNPTIYTTDNYIIAISGNKCFQFERATGKFIKKIGTLGRGPNEYMQIPDGLVLNENTKTIVTSNGTKLLEYSWVDESVRKIPTEANLKISFADKVAVLGDNNWAIAILDPAGVATNKLMFFDREKIIDSVANDNKFTMETDEMSLNKSEILFYRYKGEVLYKFLYNDTIFRVVDNCSLDPKWNFMSDNSAEKLASLRGNPSKLFSEQDSYYLIFGIIETDDYLFINGRYKGNKHLLVYNKKQGVLTRLTNDGFINDISGLPTFWPKYTNDNQELVCAYHADFVFDAVQNKKYDSDKTGKFQTIISQLTPEDNPIIVIAKLKQ